MIKHGMEVLQQATHFLNPGQIPVTTFDQPLFALAKFIQWKWPATHGENMHVVMLGGLHTEMALWSTLGDLLKGSEWTSALTEAEVASSGVADSCLRAAHVTRTRHAHQVTLLALHNLQQEASNAFVESDGEGTFDTWKQTLLDRSPTFFFWDQIMKYETLVLIFIRAHREKNFPLHVEVLDQLMPLFFALDHVNYSRWMSVHIRDMKSLPEPIKKEFKQESHFVLSKSPNKFSSIPFDQAHEQENKIVKGSGGAVGLTENPSAFRKWMLSGPEMGRILQEFEAEYTHMEAEISDQMHLHHEQNVATQRTFRKHVSKMSEAIRQMGNPFNDDFAELVTLEGRKCVDSAVAKSVVQWKTSDVGNTRSLSKQYSQNALVRYMTLSKGIPYVFLQSIKLSKSSRIKGNISKS